MELRAITRQDEPFIAWLGTDAAVRTESAGAKTAQLSRFATRHRVPPGFCLTADADDATPGSVREALIEAWNQLITLVGAPDIAVAVRSSAIDEDGPSASFAGQHDTFLNVVDVAALLEAVERCRASARTEQVCAYRQRHGLSAERIRIAVLVQQMVRADVSGVAFSANPVTGRDDEIVITASYGLGESIVGGTVTPDAWTIRAGTPDIVVARLGDKRRMTVPVAGGTREVDVPRIMRDQPSLTTSQVSEVVTLTSALRDEAGWPVDIEFAFAGGDLYLLQVRPITTLTRTQTGVVDRVLAAAS